VKIGSRRCIVPHEDFIEGSLGTSVNLVLSKPRKFLFTQEWNRGVGVRALERVSEFTMADRLFVAIPALQLIPVFQHPLHLPLAGERVNSPNTRCHGL